MQNGEVLPPEKSMSSVASSQFEARVGALVSIASTCQDTTTSPTRSCVPQDGGSADATGSTRSNTGEQQAELCGRIGSGATTLTADTQPCTERFQ